MLRALVRYTKLCRGGFHSRRIKHSSSVVLCLKWQRAEFNGVDVNLAQLGENYSPEEFSVRLKGKHWLGQDHCRARKCKASMFVSTQNL